MGGAPPLPHDFAPQGVENGPFLGHFGPPRIRVPRGGLRGPRGRAPRGARGPPRSGGAVAPPPAGARPASPASARQGDRPPGARGGTRGGRPGGSSVKRGGIPPPSASPRRETHQRCVTRNGQRRSRRSAQTPCGLESAGKGFTPFQARYLERGELIAEQLSRTQTCASCEDCSRRTPWKRNSTRGAPGRGGTPGPRGGNGARGCRRGAPWTPGGAPGARGVYISEGI